MGPANTAIGPCAKGGSPGDVGQPFESHVASLVHHDYIYYDTVQYFGLLFLHATAS